MKKTLSILLTVVMIISVLPFSLFTVTANAVTNGYYTYTVSNGEATITDVSTAISGNVTIPSTLGGYPVMIIGSSAFEGCSALTSITIPDGVTSIGGWAFSDCTSLTSITLPDSVTSIGSGAFRGCTLLTSITIPDSVTSVGVDAFSNTAYYNNSSNWENDVLYLGKHLIKANTSISGAYKTKDGTLTIAGDAFYNCTLLTSITIPDSVMSIGDDAFCNCTSLTSITIGDSVTSIGAEAFSYCISLNTVTIGDSVTSIGDWAFEYCTSLTTITIPNSVTSIGDYAFWDCDSLTSASIGNDVTSIGIYAFRGCSSLETVYFTGSESEWNAISISSGNNYLLNAKIHFNWSGVVGDFDGSSDLSASDAIFLVYYTLYGEEQYPVGQNCDFNNDGVVTTDDATYLLYYILFGNDYPLFPEKTHPDDEGFGGWLPIG